MGSGKSTWLYPEMVQFILRHHMAGTVPRILFVTGRESLAETYTERTEDALLSTKIQRAFGHLCKLPIDQGTPWTKVKFRLSGMPVEIKEPTFLASGPTGGIEGTRTNWAILDDFIDVDHALSPAERIRAWFWFTTTLVGRMDPEAWLTIIGSSWHPEDAYSMIRKQTEEEHSDMVHHKYPCWRDPPYEWGELLCPERWTRELLESRRRDIGSSFFKLRYLMNHRALVGGMFSEKNLIFLDELPEHIDAKYGGWDLALTSKQIADQKRLDPDYTAGVVVCWHPIHYDRIILVDLYRERIRTGHEDAINMMHTKHDITMEVSEDNMFQRLVRDNVRRKYPHINIIGVTNVKDKVARIKLGLEGFFERGFYIYRGMGQEKVEWFLSEFSTFPRGEHEDILDALNNIIGKMHRKGGVKLMEHDGSW